MPHHRAYPHRFRALLPLLCWLLAVAPSLAADFQVDALLNQSEVFIGEQVELAVTLRIDATQQERVVREITVLPVAGLTLVPGGGMTISTQRSPSGYTELRRQVMFFRADKAGQYRVGPIEVHFTENGQAKSQRAEGPPLTVKDPYAGNPTPAQATPPAATPDEAPPASAAQGDVQPPAAPEPPNIGQQATAEQDGLRDIKGINRAPLDFGLMMVIGSFLLLLLLAIALLLLLKKRPAPAPIVPVVAHVAPMGLLERTLKALDEIARPASLEDEQAVADYYLAVTALAKQYLWERYGFAARERTSWELRQEYRALTHHHGTETAESALKAFQETFELCDGGKYAHLHATVGLMDEAKRRAKTFFVWDNDLAVAAKVAREQAPSASLPIPATESALTGAAAGMRIKSVRPGDIPASASQRRPEALPKATRVAEDALRAPSSSSTLFTAADSAALVNQLAVPPVAVPPAEDPRDSRGS